MKSILLLSVSLTVGFCIFAQSPIMSANTFKCKWDGGYFFTYLKGSWDTGNEEWTDETIIDNINLENNTARIIANVGSGDLAVYPTSIGLMFIEQGVSALHTLLIHYTTNKDNKNMFPATYDRNIQILGVPMNSNYYGFCKIFG